ncbi:hypothetical protein J45TS6_36760 [Paenibacillus sp. J45TS6]|uniref:hypothetical protein n=1 Tax=unclassified Paenibacillus TaxID=185978 RepID=UPI001B2E9119|nr:hypothetical protein [Paenibacillus sp. J45TS6]GIP45217.1 hypothetical protein J45TS6_36760 [Paenibacillus sp. J45TS6]
MKKMIAITAALALTASFAGAASAATETTETTTTPTTNAVTVSTETTTTTTPNATTAETTVSNEPTNTTVVSTETTEDTVLVKPGDGIDLPLLPLEITETTYFYDTPNGKALGALSSQFVSVTGNEITNRITGDTWVEIYTWKGVAWVNTGK